MSARTRSLRFRSDRFDHTSELPDAFNAGNRFYGQDVGQALATALRPHGYEAGVFDEDWGWMVDGRMPDGRLFTIAIYNLNDHGEGGRPGTDRWGLWIHAAERSRWLGVVPRLRKIDVPPELEAAVVAAIVGFGAEPRAWDDGPG